ncbi:glycosyltransferase [Thiocapsa bogorovii]|nr:glycosyltransferase [Thiocapsa bogorovii]UHD15895.1 glycosyltransferase [Thiocapsa bogorovii]
MDTAEVSDLISVVIPTFNRAERVCSDISSLTAQT